ncbi:hypothetical protein FH972_018950 [Carpinus fangiana]|uniref:GST N-terminal domain-containing protein n=1 Tax=Carpinus fangiana TaxID=176857 RepID=A0A5N6RNS8_9ROSI|nr:hypothetical protein FH972_018950 [Carpinus fangiana]
MEETFEKIKLVEEGIKSIFPEGIIPPIHHDNVGVLEMVFLSIFGPYKVHEEVFGVKIIGPEKTPLLFSWLKALLEVPVVKEALPPHEKLVGFLKYIRQSALNSTAV